MEKFFIGNKLNLKVDGPDESQIPSLPSTFHILKLSSGSFIDKGDACRNARILSKVTIKLTSFREKHTKYNVLFLGVTMTSETGGSLYTCCMDM